MSYKYQTLLRNTPLKTTFLIKLIVNTLRKHSSS